MNKKVNSNALDEHAVVYSMIDSLDEADFSLPAVSLSRYADTVIAQDDNRSHPSLHTLRGKMGKKIGNVFDNRNIMVDILAIFFGIGTWITVNGTFIQLPLLVNDAPEGWSLPSYLSIMIQIGNFGPLSYTIIQKYSKRKINDAIAICILLLIGTLACLFTAFYYNKTAYIFDAEHSLALFILTILTSLNACTSSVLYMPYMGRFKEKYLVTYFIGEGLSGLLPSVVALAQNISSRQCVLVNSTESGDIYESINLPPNFGTNTFFLILFSLMVCSYFGFILLDQLPLAKREYTEMSVEFGNKYSYQRDNNGYEQQRRTSKFNENGNENQTQHLSKAQYCCLLILIGIISFFSNGMFGSIQSYSALPYGDSAYHYAATLSVIANPIACFLAIFFKFTSLRLIAVLSLLSAILTAYAFVTAVLSPYPPLYDTIIGAMLVVIVWTLLYGMVSYAKLGITAVMRAQGGQSLVWVGSLTQLGSAFGSVLIFLCINYSNSFHQAESKC